MIRLKEIDMFYFDTKADGPAILCLHGRWGRAQAWYDFMQRYGAKYRVIAPDQRGHGLSGKPISKYTSGEMAADIAELTDELHTGPVLLVGHSMGGRVAGHFAAAYPQKLKALAILDVTANGTVNASELAPEQIPSVDPYTKDWPMPFASLMEAMTFIRQAEESEFSYQHFLNSLTETPEGYQMMFSPQAIAANIANSRGWFHLLPAISCPVLLVRSSSHLAIPDEDWVRMQAQIPDCTAVEMSHPDHNVMQANKKEFYTCFDAFLKKVGM